MEDNLIFSSSQFEISRPVEADAKVMCQQFGLITSAGADELILPENVSLIFGQRYKKNHILFEENVCEIRVLLFGTQKGFMSLVLV